MGFRSLNSSIKKLATTLEKQRKAQLRTRSGNQWLAVMRDEYIKQYNRPEGFVINETNVTMNRHALDFSIIYQSENTRLMNPVTRKAIKSFLKDLEKDLESN